MCSSSFIFDLSYVVYLRAKNAPTTKPGIEIISMEPSPIDKARSTARKPEDSEAIMSIRTEDFVTANSLDITSDGISRFLS